MELGSTAYRPLVVLPERFTQLPFKCNLGSHVTSPVEERMIWLPSRATRSLWELYQYLSLWMNTLMFWMILIGILLMSTSGSQPPSVNRNAKTQTPYIAELDLARATGDLSKIQPGRVSLGQSASSLTLLTCSEGLEVQGHPASISRDVRYHTPTRPGSALRFQWAESGKKVIRLTKELVSITAEILWGFLISAPIMTSLAHHRRRHLICARFSWLRSDSMKNWRWVFISYISSSWQISREIHCQEVVAVFV